jgi:hypothetical protein
MDAIMAVLIFIMEKIKEKPDPNAKPAIDFDNKTAAEREKQVSAPFPPPPLEINVIFHSGRLFLVNFSLLCY